MASHVVSFRFSCRAGEAMAFRLVHRPVPRLVAASRFSSRLSSRGGVPFVSRGLAFSCRRCPVAPFLSARVPVLSRLVLSLPSFYSCSSRRSCRVAACRVAGRGGVAGRRCVVDGFEAV